MAYIVYVVFVSVSDRLSTGLIVKSPLQKFFFVAICISNSVDSRREISFKAMTIASYPFHLRFSERTTTSMTWRRWVA